MKIVRRDRYPVVGDMTRLQCECVTEVLVDARQWGVCTPYAVSRKFKPENGLAEVASR